MPPLPKPMLLLAVCVSVPRLWALTPTLSVPPAITTSTPGAATAAPRFSVAPGFSVMVPAPLMAVTLLVPPPSTSLPLLPRSSQPPALTVRPPDNVSVPVDGVNDSPKDEVCNSAVEAVLDGVRAGAMGTQAAAAVVAIRPTCTICPRPPAGSSPTLSR